MKRRRKKSKLVDEKPRRWPKLLYDVDKIKKQQQQR